MKKIEVALLDNTAEALEVMAYAYGKTEQDFIRDSIKILWQLFLQGRFFNMQTAFYSCDVYQNPEDFLKLVTDNYIKHLNHSSVPDQEREIITRLHNFILSNGALYKDNRKALTPEEEASIQELKREWME